MTIVPDGVSGGGITAGAAWPCGDHVGAECPETIEAMLSAEVVAEEGEEEAGGVTGRVGVVVAVVKAETVGGELAACGGLGT